MTPDTPTRWDDPALQARLRQRLAREQRFRAYGLAAIGITCLALAALIASVLADGAPELFRNASLYLSTDSRSAENAGLRTAMVGSILMLVLIAGLAVPVGMASALYLSEFAPRSVWGARITRGLDVVINNLAAVPGIVFGLLGLAVFINTLGLIRSSILVGGLVLALRSFPTVIIASRGALDAVPDAIMDGALALGASRMQAVFGHKVPLAAPGMVTGAILALAQALGEAAPLLLIGMVAFFTQSPAGMADPATALPVQILMWSDNPGEAWTARAAAAILVLLVLLLAVNGLAAWVRVRFERRRVR